MSDTYLTYIHTCIMNDTCNNEYTYLKNLRDESAVMGKMSGFEKARQAQIKGRDGNLRAFSIRPPARQIAVAAARKPACASTILYRGPGFHGMNRAQASLAFVGCYQTEKQTLKNTHHIAYLLQATSHLKRKNKETKSTSARRGT